MADTADVSKWWDFCLDNSVTYNLFTNWLGIKNKHNRSMKFETEDPSKWWDFCLGNSVTYDVFANWLGDINSPSRIALRTYLKEKKYCSILDIPCGLCIDYIGIKKDGIKIDYTGNDLSKKLINKAKSQNINVKQGNIENIEYPDNSFDIVFCRHILEHLKYYDKALSETIRVAKKEVLIVFFIKPSPNIEDKIELGLCDGYYLYHNIYSMSKFSNYVLALPKVENIFWEDINENEIIAHILIKN